MRKSLLLFAIFLSTLTVNAQHSLNKRVLANLGGQKVTVGEFLNIYKENNLGDQDTVSIKHAVNLYINFRLKVMEAENLKMDTLASFKSELEGYRKELAKPYFVDKKINEALLKEAFERSRFDIRVSQILIKVSPYASPADTLKAWKKIIKIRNEILKGKNFGQAAVEYSDDPSARNQKAIPGRRSARKGNRGDLGYFTVFNMVYPFESAAYNTPVGQISQPIRTRYGYYLIKVTDKRPAMGVAEVEHIFVAMKPGASTADSIAKAKKIQDIYLKIKKGMPFEEAAKKYSEDKGSSYLGGRLPKFTSERIVPQFVINVDTLRIGQVSRPFQTIYGFHIIKLLSRKKPGNFKEEEPKLKEQLAISQRSNLSKQAVIVRLKKKNHLKIFPKAKHQLFVAIETRLATRNLVADSLKNMIKPLFKIGRNAQRTFISQYDFALFAQKYQINSKSSAIRDVMLNKLFDKFVGEKVIAYENTHLGAQYPEFRDLMKEYHDGILLFNLTDKMVWSKATNDTLGLKKFYLEHHNQYQWKPRVKATILETSKPLVKKLQTAIASYQNNDSLFEAIGRKEIPGFKGLKPETGVFQKGDNKIVDQVKWVKGWSQPVTLVGENKAAIVLITQILPHGPKSYEEALGQIISDYQDYLQKQWVSELRSKYPVKINQKVLKKLKKQYPNKK